MRRERGERAKRDAANVFKRRGAGGREHPRQINWCINSLLIRSARRNTHLAVRTFSPNGADGLADVEDRAQQ
jgi:uncharacterized protein with von Willebrand factor type A (vWA) domain